MDHKELNRRRVILEHFCKELGITPDQMTEVHITLFELVLKFNAGELQPRDLSAIKYFTEEITHED